MKAKWVQFTLTQPKPDAKTSVWIVYATQGLTNLGCVAWYGPWRKYAFFPNEGTLYEPTCLRDIATFIDEEMTKRKAARKAK